MKTWQKILGIGAFAIASLTGLKGLSAEEHLIIDYFSLTSSDGAYLTYSKTPLKPGENISLEGRLYIDKPSNVNFYVDVYYEDDLGKSETIEMNRTDNNNPFNFFSKGEHSFTGTYTVPKHPAENSFFNKVRFSAIADQRGPVLNFSENKTDSLNLEKRVKNGLWIESITKEEDEENVYFKIKVGAGGSLLKNMGEVNFSTNVNLNYWEQIPEGDILKNQYKQESITRGKILLDKIEDSGEDQSYTELVFPIKKSSLNYNDNFPYGDSAPISVTAKVSFPLDLDEIYSDIYTESFSIEENNSFKNYQYTHQSPTSHAGQGLLN